MQQGNVASPTYSSRLVTMFVGINIISALLVGIKVMVLLAMYAYRESLPREKGERKSEDYSHGDQEKTLSKEQQTEQKPIVQAPEKTLQRYNQSDQEPPKGVPETSPMRQAKDIPKRLSKDQGQERPESLVTGQQKILAGEYAKGQVREMPKQPPKQPVQEPLTGASRRHSGPESRDSPTTHVHEIPIQLLGQPPLDQELPKGVSEKSPMRQAKDIHERLSKDQEQERPESLVTGQQKIMAGEPTKVQVREMPKQPPKQPVQEELKGASRRYSDPESRDSHRIHVHEIQIQLPGQQVQEQSKDVPGAQLKIVSPASATEQPKQEPIQLPQVSREQPKELVQESGKYIGLPGEQPGAAPKAQPRPQVMPWQGMSAQGIPAHGISVRGVQGMPGQGIPGQEIRGQGMQEQGIQAQVLPRQGMTGQEMKMQGMQGQGMQGQGMQGQWMQGRKMPGKGIREQGMPWQGIPGQRMQGQGMQGQLMPGQGWPAQGMPAQGMPKQGLPAQGFPGQGIPGQGISVQGMQAKIMPGQGMPKQGMPVQGMPAYGVSEPALPRRGVPADRMSSPLPAKDQEAVVSGSAELPPVGNAAQQHPKTQAPLPSASQERRQKGMARKFYMYYK
ncbi:unnamed protein product [Ixodes pacificus]